MLVISDIRTTPHGGAFPYTQPETGVQFKELTWNGLLSRVLDHRRANHLDLAEGWQDRLQTEVCQQNSFVPCHDNSIPDTYESPLATQGRAMWLELHAYTEAYPENPTEEQKEAASRWFNDWVSRIPNFICHCRRDFDKLLAGFKPDFSSRATFVNFARVAHDWVSFRIGHPLFDPDRFNASPAKNIS